MTAPTTPSADYVSVLRAALEDACLALKQCYNVTEWPADGTTAQDESMRKGLAVLALASPAAIGPETAKAVHQLRSKAHRESWQETDADGETCVKRNPHWADLYEFRTLYTATTQPERAQEQPSDTIYDQLARDILATPAAQVSKADASELPLDFTRPLETFAGTPVAYICSDVVEIDCARVCVDQATGVVYSSPYTGLNIRNTRTAPAITEPAPAAGSNNSIRSAAFDILLDNYVNSEIEHRQELGSFDDARAAHDVLIAHIDARPPVAPQGESK